jgi:diguanylate cyclase (GGDEF)-like protein
VVESEAGITVSLGVSSYHESLQDKEALIGEADKALYQAKQNGRNRVEMCI